MTVDHLVHFHEGFECVLSISISNDFVRLDALAKALSVIATATWLAGWLAGCLSQPVLYQND